MIFNFGENPTMDVIRMLLHYSLQQNKAQEQQQAPLQQVPPAADAATPAVKNVASPVAENEGARRLHVTNLPFKIKDQELKKYFEEYGTVQDAEIIYNERGSKGFGFVTMVTEADASKVKEALNGKEIEGRKIEINHATPKSSKARLKVRPTTTTVQPNGRINRTTAIATAIQQQWKQQSTTPVLQSYAMTAPALPPAAVAPPVTPVPPMTPSPYQYFPTPEQYAQYYHYMTSQGAIQNPYQTQPSSQAVYRYQPY